MLTHLPRYSLDRFVKCQALYGCSWRVYLDREAPRRCDDHGGAGWGLPQYREDEEGRIVEERHCAGRLPASDCE